MLLHLSCGLLLTDPAQPGGRDITVTAENVDEYVQEVLDAIIGKGALAQAKAFKDGFSKVFPITDLQAFTSDELVMLFGNGEEDWSNESEYLFSPIPPYRC
jgi:E3 ubiquitin-protein ligase TRIP12